MHEHNRVYRSGVIEELPIGIAQSPSFLDCCDCNQIISMVVCDEDSI